MNEPSSSRRLPTRSARREAGAAVWAKILWVFIILIGPLLFWLLYVTPRTGLVKFANSTDPNLRVLFIGNSLTYMNDMPAIIVGIFKQRQPTTRLKVFATTQPGYTLSQHAQLDDTKQAMHDGPWDIVVLQEQSQMPLNEVDAKNMDEYCVWFDNWIRSNHARTVLLMTWCDLKKPIDQAAISKAYRDIGRKLNAAVIPAGDLMLEVSQKEPDIPLYMADGHHPGPYGSYLVACLICDVLGHMKSQSASGSIDEQAMEVFKKNAVNIPDPIAEKLQKYADDFADAELKRH